MFRITDNKGFQITFKNGYTISCQFGTSNYCDRRSYTDPYGSELGMRCVESENCADWMHFDRGQRAYRRHEGGNCMSSIDQMRELLAGATVSKFSTLEACRAFKDGVSQCIQIMEEENNSHKAEKGTGSVGAEMVRLSVYFRDIRDNT